LPGKATVMLHAVRAGVDQRQAFGKRSPGGIALLVVVLRRHWLNRLRRTFADDWMAG
jgi:hypothetical protein